MLVRHLPPDSALAREMGVGWSVTDYLLALIADLLQGANWQRQGDSNAKRPTPIPRPGQPDEEEERIERLDAQARAFRDRQRQRGGAA